MINWRVMGNRLGYGTFCALDCLPSPEAASSAMRKLNKKNPHGNSYFIQEYEEARVGKNKLEPAK